MTPTRFDQKLQAYLRGALNERESRNVELWLHVMHLKGYRGIELTRSNENELAQLVVMSDDHLSLRNFRPRFASSAPPQRRGEWLVLMLTILLILSISVPFIRGTTARQIHRPSTIERVDLSKSVTGWVSGESTIAAGGSHHFTAIVFNGEGLFEGHVIDGDGILIETNCLQLELSGTCFVDTGPADVVVSVLAGEVWVSTDAERMRVLVREGERVVCKGAVLTKSAVLSGEIPDRYIRSQEMNFKATEVSAIVKRIQEKFRVSLVHSGGFKKFGRINLDVTGLSLQTTLDSLGAALDLRYRSDDEVVEFMHASTFNR